MTTEKCFFLKNLKFRARNLSVLLLLFILLSACGEYRVKDLTSKIKPTNPIPPYSSIIMEVNEIWLFEADKNRRVFISHDFITIGIHFSIINKSDQPFNAIIERLNSQIKGVFNYRGTIDTLHFITDPYRDTISVNSHSNLSTSLGSDVYFFDELFEKKKDYTSDMIEVLNSLHIFYDSDTTSISMVYSEDLKVYGKSTKR